MVDDLLPGHGGRQAFGVGHVAEDQAYPEGLQTIDLRVFRTRQVTSSPRAASAATKCVPMNPLAPVTRTLAMSPIYGLQTTILCTP